MRALRLVCWNPDDARECVRELTRLPEGAQLRVYRRGRCDLLLWFVRGQRELERGVARNATAPCWIIWPKRASGVRADVTQNSVRTAGLAAGLADFKVCSVDAVWSGLLFRWRRP